MSRLSRAIRFFVTLPPSQDLLICAKDLFVAAIRQPSPVARTRFKTLIWLKRFGAVACGGHGFNKQIFGADEQVPERGSKRLRSVRPNQ